MKKENLKFAKRAIVIAAFFCLSCLGAHSQTTNTAVETPPVLEQGVAPHKGLDGFFDSFPKDTKNLMRH